MSMLCRWNLEEWDTLRVPEEKWRLDLLLDQNSTTGRKPLFESLDACWQENIRRAEALKRLPKQLYPGNDRCNPMKLASDLIDAANDRRIVRCAASGAYMRDRRLT